MPCAAGVEEDADAATIKKAYHKLAMRHHPDKVTGDEAAAEAAAEKFKEIVASYNVLKNGLLRPVQRYDHAPCNNKCTRVMLRVL